MLEKLGSKMRQNEPSWTKLAASCGEELPRCCQDSQLGHFVTSLDTISNDFFFCRWVGIAKSMKTTNSPSLLLDFRKSEK
jgi:hypothetical protein